MTSRLLITDDMRRARLAHRQAVAPQCRVADAEAATRAMTVLHATEPATVHLSAFARVDGLTVADVDAELYESRCVVKQLAMRRTLFVFPRDLLPAAWGSASARVAGSEERRVAKAVVEAGITAEDGVAWLRRAEADVLAALDDAGGLTTAQVREAVPHLDTRASVSPNSRWGADVPVIPWILTILGLRGHAVRGDNTGHWRISRARWTPMGAWLGETPDHLTADEGYAELVRRWLGTFGPGTHTDLVWWLGSTKTAVTRALADVGAVEVDLERGDTGYVLPDDPALTGVVEPKVEPWAALLPTLDPTTMGWRGRDFYLDAAHVPHLFDTNGNAGTTAWVNGRIVGCWVQDEAGVVRVVTLHDPGSAARSALDAEAERLTAWLDGVRITNVYSSPAMKAGWEATRG